MYNVHNDEVGVDIPPPFNLILAKTLFRFDFLFAVVLGELLLRHSHNLSKSLQHLSMYAAEGQELARLTVEVSKSLCNPENFESFFEGIIAY